MTAVVRRLLGPLLALCCLGPSVAVAGCVPAHPGAPASGPRPMLSYLGQAQVPFDASVAGAAIGGLSGISYDAGRQIYYVLSDDRSKTGPARFFTVRLSLSDKGIDDIAITGMHPLLDRSGQSFRPLKLDGTTPFVEPVVPPDPEGIAFDAARQRLYWSSEGERLTDREPVLADPWVRIAGTDGGYLGEFALPPNLAMSAQSTGPRRNQALEGLALTPDGRSLFAAMEAPGYNDGPVAAGDRGALTRITKFDVATAAPSAQYAYPTEPAAGSAERNGVSDLVALSDTTFLVVERSKAVPPVVRVFRAEVGAATDVLAMPSMQGAALTPMSKTLAADLSATSGSSPAPNIEGITLGPTLPDGRQSVVLVADNDFAPGRASQFLLYAMS
ncbi:esterase-like activity of phytase family protein [Mycobacterium shinjukuense]|uniref:esterase-like activity of phytase family protein n=1 Tax=Mycobacterium shinjukuense TaxID=398694 RepID=UPI001152C24A|nr:esterase-like activity of phytase family protein [Mycobacterium shinjukuense]MCV6986623.1 esterase-like activity of phytase family protein [Mycobacterium shinjukuense]